MTLADDHPGLLRVAEQELVERRAGHLEGLGGGRLDRLREVGVLLDGAVEGPEARAPLLDESGGGDRVLDAQGPEDLVRPGELGLADVEAGKLVPLQQEDPAPAPRERGGRAGAAWPAAADDSVEVTAAAPVIDPGWDVVTIGLRRQDRDRPLVLARAHGAVGEDAVLGDPLDGLVVDLLRVGRGG